MQFEYSENDICRIKNAFVIQLSVIIAMCILFGKTQWDGRIWIIRGSVSTDPNSLSAWLIIPICILFEKFFSRRGKKKPVYIFLIIVTGYIALLTGSRAGIICIAFCAILCVLYALKSNIKANPVLALGIIVFAMFLFGVTIKYIPESVVTRFTSSNTTELGGRIGVWTDMFSILAEHPFGVLFGFGESATMHYTAHVAHNLYIETLFNQGIIGLSLVLFYLYKSFRNTIKDEPYFAIALLGMAIMAASLSEFSSRPVMLCFFIAGLSRPKRSNIYES